MYSAQVKGARAATTLAYEELRNLVTIEDQRNGS